MLCLLPKLRLCVAARSSLEIQFDFANSSEEPELNKLLADRNSHVLLMVLSPITGSYAKFTTRSLPHLAMNRTIISKKTKICEDIVCGTSESFKCGWKLQQRNERLLPLEKVSSVLDNWTTPAIGFLCKTYKVAASFSFS